MALEYNKIRSDLGELLRSIEELRVVEDREKLYLIIKNLQKGKEILKEIDTLTLSNVEHLISVRKSQQLKEFQYLMIQLLLLRLLKNL